MTILNNILAVSWHEFRVICTRYSILLVLSGGIFVYGLLYNYMYAPNVAVSYTHLMCIRDRSWIILRMCISICSII